MLKNCYYCGNGNVEKGICEVFAALEDDDPKVQAIAEWIGNNTDTTGEHPAVNPAADGCPCWKEKYDVEEAGKILREGIARIRAAEQNAPSKPLTASEALFAFAAWLTTLDGMIKVGAKHDSAIWAHLVDEFIKANELAETREGWHNLVRHPEKDVLG